MAFSRTDHLDARLPGIEYIKASLPTSTYAVVAYAFMCLIGVYTLVQRSDYYALLSFSEIVWNSLVYATPPSIVLALDRTDTQSSSSSDDDDKTTYANARTFAAKSTAMRRILGLDGTGVLTNVQRTRSLSGLGSIFKSSPTSALPGLGNWDNSCYQNSILQGLSALPTLHRFLEEAKLDRPSEDSWSTNEALQFLIEELNSPKNVGQKIWTPPALKNMSSWQQQDAQEYYSKVVDEMEKEIMKTSKTAVVKTSPGAREVGLGSLGNETPRAKLQDGAQSEMTNESASGQPIESPTDTSAILRNPLEGLLAQRVGCLQCGYVEGLSMIPFNCLTVPLGRQFGYDLRTCLDEYTTLEPINGVECAKCTLLRAKQQLDKLLAARQNTTEDGTEAPLLLSGAARSNTEERLRAVDDALSSEDFAESTIAKKCMIPSKNRVTSTKSRQAVVARPPKALVVHVNRSMFDEYSGMLSKNHADVRFPKTLDLSTWCLGSAMGDDAAEHWNTDPSQSMLGDPLDAPDVAQRPIDPATMYTLRAVVTHYGRHENGHYIAYRQTPQHVVSNTGDGSEAQWWRLSDEDVSTVSEDNVLAQGGVFMMFYEQVPHSAPPKEAMPGKIPADALPSYAEPLSQDKDILSEQPVPPSSGDEGLGEVALGSDGPDVGEVLPLVHDPIVPDVLDDTTGQKRSTSTQSYDHNEAQQASDDKIQSPTSSAPDSLPRVDKDNYAQILRMRTSGAVTSKQDLDHLGKGSGLLQAV